MSTPRDLVVGTAGHIDHGKTSLILALTGVDCDRLPDEKARGITIDLGFAAIKSGTNCISLVDVPGHERFIRNMLAGATGLDSALLIVAADDGVMPQTREHLEILKHLRLAGGVVVLTKCDLASPDWLDLVEEDVRNLTVGSCFEHSEIIRTSVTTGTGIREVRNALERLSESLRARTDLGPFRMAIDRVFSRPGHGTIVTGTVLSGMVCVGAELEWQPHGRAVRVRGLHRHDVAVDSVARGTRAAINLAGVHASEIQRGDELAETGYLKPSRILSVEVSVSADSTHELKHRGRYRLHLGTSEIASTLALTEANRILPGETGFGQLFTERPVVAISGQPFVLRLESPMTTVGGGRILQPVARRSRRRDRTFIAILKKLTSSDAGERIAGALANHASQPWTALDLCRDSAVPLAEVARIVEGLARSGELIDLAIGAQRTVQVPRETVVALEDRVVRAIHRLHQRNPRHSFIRRLHLGSELPDLSANRMIDPVVSRLIQDGRVVGDSASVALSSFKPGLSQAEKRLKNELVRAFQQGGFAPPEFSEIAARPGVTSKTLRELFDLLVDEGRLVSISPGLYLDHEREKEMRELVRGRLGDSRSMTLAELRDLLGTTRKYAVPFAEYLDRIGLTSRNGDLRVLASNRVEMTPNE